VSSWVRIPRPPLHALRSTPGLGGCKPVVPGVPCLGWLVLAVAYWMPVRLAVARGAGPGGGRGDVQRAARSFRSRCRYWCRAGGGGLGRSRQDPRLSPPRDIADGAKSLDDGSRVSARPPLVQRLEEDGEDEERPCGRDEPVVDPVNEPRAQQEPDDAQDNAEHYPAVDRLPRQVTRVCGASSSCPDRRIGRGRPRCRGGVCVRSSRRLAGASGLGRGGSLARCG
jgi:hypothetical protein